MKPSSATEGYFQQEPRVENQFNEDAGLRRAFEFFLPASVRGPISHELSSFGEKVLSKPILGWIADAERNPPYLRTWDTWGRRMDELVTSEGWRNLQDLGISEGIVAIAYEKRFGALDRVHQFLKYHLWSGSCANVTCPSAMTDGAAGLLSKYASSDHAALQAAATFNSAFERLTTRNPLTAWTSGQWMTERKGGSNVSGTETIARIADRSLGSKALDGSPLGPYSVYGFKWFSSATDADMAVFLARDHSDGISAFYAPIRRTSISRDSRLESEMNGIAIQRLKSKLGTRPLPTAELELMDMRAHMIGTQGRGIRAISTVLNITRVHNAVTALGYWGRGLAISRAFARVRIIGDQLLSDLPSHVRTMAAQTIQYRGYMHLTFFTVFLLGLCEHPRSPTSHIPIAFSPSILGEAPLLVRLLTPVVKALTAKACIAGLQECMESLGGIGYLENDDMRFNIARLFRDANVLSIWEGTTDVMAADAVRVLKGQNGGKVLTLLDELVEPAQEAEGGFKQQWGAWKAIVASKSVEELRADGRTVITSLGHLIGYLLLLLDHHRDGDIVAGEVARRWGGFARQTGRTQSWESRIAMDRVIALGGVYEPSPIPSKL